MEGFPTRPSVPQFLNLFSFDLIEFLMTMLFNIQSLWSFRSKDYETTSMQPYSTMAFQGYQLHNWGVPWFVRCQCDKQNKQT